MKASIEQSLPNCCASDVRASATCKRPCDLFGGAAWEAAQIGYTPKAADSHCSAA